jgi:Right handed beta helix region/Secretion system C-terminal sorting domain
MKKFLAVSFTYFLIFTLAQAQTMYVSPTGNASLNGQDINNPTTLTHATSLLTTSTTTAVTIYLRGGTYTMTAGISLAASRSGTAANIKNLFAYPGDARPVLDFSSMSRATTTITGVRGVSFSPSYWCIKGVDFFNASDNGMFMGGSNNKVENCYFYENQDTGLQLGSTAANNQIINCDSYYNVDPSQGNADGYAAKLDVGTGNSFTGCRAWQNSDDGWDGYMRPSDDVSTTLDNCWAFKNGYLKSGAVATNGNGNGFKMGGSDFKDLRHNFTVTRCLAFQNKVRGFDQNNNKGSMILQNCTSWNNGQNYGMNSSGVTLAAGKVMTLTNCISLTTTTANAFNGVATFTTDSWLSGFSASAADFQSIDPTAAYGARQADGSLPNITFMHLATTSTLRNRGTNVGLAFNGTAPDLGAFETTEALPITLLSFSATAKGEKNSIQWATASEQNNALFIVEHSADGLDFIEIKETKGAGTTGGAPQYYTVIDDNPIKGINYYRLRQRDYDGKETFSKTVSVNNASNSTTKLKVYPSVTNQFLTVETQIEDNAILKVIDNLGRIVLSKKIETLGSASTNLDVHGLTNGLYILIVETGSTQIIEKFIKQ